ncbi:MAG: hypothetical protein M3T49_05395 [Candidatus Eremiobacteraeota bacterium]|nr:hypothetical protein [Candidatus Eremiobacteraeota bacterium]
MTKAAADCSFITFAGLAELDPDDRLAADLLSERGYRVQAVSWDDPAVDWSAAGTCVIRSTWNYHLRYGDFMHWLQRVQSATQLWNPAPLVRWNADKRYLRQLGQAGIPIVETLWLQSHAEADVAARAALSGWSDVVIKPAVGLATFGTRRANLAAGDLSAVQSHVDRLLQDGAVLVQPYMTSVERYGERALVFIDGRYSHAVRKTAFQQLLPAGEAGETSVEAAPEEIDLAARVINCIDGPTLYARVDLVRDDAGAPRLIELELIEPSLFFGLCKPAAQGFADALERLMQPRPKAHERAG